VVQLVTDLGHVEGVDHLPVGGRGGVEVDGGQPVRPSAAVGVEQRDVGVALPRRLHGHARGRIEGRVRLEEHLLPPFFLVFVFGFGNRGRGWSATVDHRSLQQLGDHGGGAGGGVGGDRAVARLAPDLGGDRLGDCLGRRPVVVQPAAGAVRRATA